MSKTFLFCLLAAGLAYGGYLAAHRSAPLPEPLAVVAPEHELGAPRPASPLDAPLDDAHHSMDEIDPERQSAGK